MIVDDIEKDGEPASVARLDEPLQRLRRSVLRSGSVAEDAVISPIPASGKLANRHQLDRGRAEPPDVIEMTDRPGEVAGFGKGADMQLVDDDCFPRAAAPAEIAPVMLRGIDDLARTVNAFGLVT